MSTGMDGRMLRWVGEQGAPASIKGSDPAGWSLSLQPPAPQTSYSQSSPLLHSSPVPRTWLQRAFTDVFDSVLIAVLEEVASVFCGCCSKLPCTWWLKTQIYHLTVLWGGSPKQVSMTSNQGVPRAVFLWEGSAESASLPFHGRKGILVVRGRKLSRIVSCSYVQSKTFE